MNYANDIEHFNHVNKSALKIIPKLFKREPKAPKHSQIRKMMSQVEREINDLKDAASIYENPKFATHLKLKQLKLKLNQLTQMLN